LSAAGVDATSATPQGLTRAYIISAYLPQQGGVGASIELIVDPNAQHTTAMVASETILLAKGPNGDYLVTSALPSPLHDESAGPHVVRVSSNTAGGVTTLVVSFDSDLDPNSVAAAISVLSQGRTLNSTAVYYADTRSATVTISNAPAGTLTLDIATTLADFKGQTLTQSFMTNVETSS
jgi:hypothetical protein